MFLINFIICLAVALLLFFNFFKQRNNKKTRKIVNYLSCIGILYFLVSIFCFLWLLNSAGYMLPGYQEDDFVFIYSLTVLIQSIFLFMIAYSFSANSKMFYFLLFYIIIFLSFFSSVFNFLYLFLTTSFLLTLLLFLSLLSRHEECRISSYFGIFYSVISLLFSILLLFRIGNIFIFSIISNLVFFAFFFIFIKNIKKYPCAAGRSAKAYGQNKLLSFLRYFVFILVLTNFVFIATIAIHELGHLAVSKFYGCQDVRIVYEREIYTQVSCGSALNNNILLLGGVLLPLLIAAVLFIVDGKFIKDISLLVVGFDLMASHKDLLDMGFSWNIVLLSLIAGALFLIAGIAMLIRSRLEETFYAL
jgi:hypothetical protein